MKPTDAQLIIEAYESGVTYEEIIEAVNKATGIQARPAKEEEHEDE